MNPRINVGKGVSGAVRYVMGQGRDPKTGELRPQAANENESRVDWIGGQNFGFRIESADDAELARRIMEFDALNQSSRTRKCEQDCVHLSLSWKPGEEPSRQEMEETARDALKALGMENAKALFIAHDDEDHAHVHIVASKINPATGRAYDLAGSYRTLSRWAQDYELAHGGILSTRREGANELRDAVAGRDADAVLAALTKQRATFTDQQLHRALEKEIIGPARGIARVDAEKELARFHGDVLARPQLVELVDDRKAGEQPARRFTTQAVLNAEQQVSVAVRDLAENFSHAVSDRTRQKIAADKTMSDEQIAAFIHATLAGGFAVVDGQAGTGKSYTIAAVREAYEDTGRRVIGLAPTNAVAQDMRADGFQHAATIHSEMFALNNDRRHWDARTVVIVDEAAMLDTKLMAMVTSHAAAAGAKLVLVGDDRQLSSIDHGGMFAVLKDRFGAAELAEVKRQHKNDERRASEMFASGNFNDALNIYDGKGAIHWTRTQREARAELIDQWTQDSAAAPEKTRFVFAYTNADVDTLNAALRDVRKQRGELGDDHQLATAYGRRAFATGDRIQFTKTDKQAGIFNGAAGTIVAIDGTHLAVKLDGRGDKIINFDAVAQPNIRHGYAGTIYKAQGRTLDQTYLYHSEHWRSASSYVAMTRHRDKAALFVARNTAKDVKQLARQMGRTDDRRAASMFAIKHDLAGARSQPSETPRRLSPPELLAEFSPKGDAGDIEAQQRDSTRSQPAAAEPRAAQRGERQARRYAEMNRTHRAAEAAPAQQHANETAPEIARSFTVAGNRTMTPAAPNFDRDAADAAWQDKVAAAGIAHAGSTDPQSSTDPRNGRSAEPRPVTMDDYYPPAEPTETQQAARKAAAPSAPAAASTGPQRPESRDSVGIWRGLARFLFGTNRREAADAAKIDAPTENRAQVAAQVAETDLAAQQEREQQAAMAVPQPDSGQADDLADWTPKRRQRQRRGQSL